MFSTAVYCLFALLLSLGGCADAQADVSSTDRFACSVAAVPVAPALASNPALVDQIPPTPIAATPITTKAATPVKVVTEKKVKAKIPESGLYAVSGYTSTIGQTDPTPCIAADQTNICRRKAAGELICASNAFELGTRIHVAGLGTCVVADRMNSRYQHAVDWYFGQDAPPPKGHEKDLKYLPKLRKAMKIDRNGPPRLVTIISQPR